MDNYTIMEKIGKGTHGTVYLLKSKEEKKYVVCKSVLNKFKSHAYREILILSKLNHRRVTKLIDSIIFKDSIFIILEYINYGSLESMISFFYKNTIFPHPNIGWAVISQISDALCYIHSKDIIHRDIKPSNILISKFYVKEKEFLEFKLCDFSLSVKNAGFISDGHTVGTPYYMSPEMVGKIGYDSSIDCWGLGCCLYELLNLKKPFQGHTREELFGEIRAKEIVEDTTEDSYLDEVIKSCLRKKDRVNSRELVKNEKIRLNLAMQELKHKESKIEELEKRISELKQEKKLV